MEGQKRVARALISVYEKEPALGLIEALHNLGVELVSTGGTLQFINSLGIPAVSVESLTGYPSIFGGRIKTLHPAIFGGILFRADVDLDNQQLIDYNILPFDMVVVDLYPFGETLASGANHSEILEKIDIGGISLLRAAAKNYHNVLVIPSRAYFDEAVDLLEVSHGSSNLEERRRYAAAAFRVSTTYDAVISGYLGRDFAPVFFKNIDSAFELRYGENPHQKGLFFGNLDEVFRQLQGKPLSFNNLLDIDAAVSIIGEFDEPTVAIIKHTNACGIASRQCLLDAWEQALAGDPISAFGGIIAANRPITRDVAIAMDKIFFEVLIAPGFDHEGLEILGCKKNRIILLQKVVTFAPEQFRSILGGVLWQSTDYSVFSQEKWQNVTIEKPNEAEQSDLRFANIVARHLKSNAIALVKGKKLLGMGAGQTSRIDALKQAIGKAKEFGNSLNGAVVASDAFFPFSDGVKMASEAGISAVVQPGGSIRDQDSIDYCNQVGMKMVFTGTRHFRH